MTKSIKKIFAILLVVATMAVMIPFGASADRNASTDVTFKLSDSSVVGKFRFDIYKIAGVNTTTGEVTPATGIPTELADTIIATIIYFTATSVIIASFWNKIYKKRYEKKKAKLEGEEKK